MSVFISWSGEASRQLACAVRTFVGTVIQRSHPWMSERDIVAGRVWDSEIQENLDRAKFGIVCLTPDNVTSPWLNYEVGALSKQVEKEHVCPLLLGFNSGSDIAQPLGRFQAKLATEAGIRDLIAAINTTLPEPVSDEIRDRSFDGQWRALEQAIAAIELGAKRVRRDDAEILDEILSHVRALRQDIDLHVLENAVRRQWDSVVDELTASKGVGRSGKLIDLLRSSNPRGTWNLPPENPPDES